MAYPKLSSFDATAFAARLKEAIPKRPDGTLITVWDAFPPFVQSLRQLRDAAAATDVFAHDVKNDLDNFRSNKVNPMLADHEARLDALENSPSNPFPG
jgi:hypothetical protein